MSANSIENDMPWASLKPTLNDSEVNQPDPEDWGSISGTEKNKQEIAVHSMLDAIKDVSLDESKMYVFENMMSLLQKVPEQYEQIAFARLALLGSVTGLVEQNASLMSLVQNVCDKFDVTVKVTEVNGTTVFEKDLPIKAGLKYDVKTLQMGMIALIAKMNSIVVVGKDKDSLVSNANNTIETLRADVRRLNGRLNDIQNVPLPPAVEKQYRLARTYTKDDKVVHSYITKDDVSGYKATRHLSKAIQWDEPEKALERLVHLNQNALEYPISHIYEYGLVSVHTIGHSGKGSSELQLALSQARARAEKNLRK